MKIAVTFTPPAMTSEQYDAVVSQLDNSGAFPLPAGSTMYVSGPGTSYGWAKSGNLRKHSTDSAIPSSLFLEM